MKTYNNIPTTPVRSTAIQAVGYDARKQTMAVTFRSGQTYLYRGVRRATATRLIRSQSPGRFFHRNVRGKYSFHKVA